MRRSRLRASIQLDLIRQFVAGVPARTAAELSGVNRNTAILYFHKLRELIAERLADEARFLDGEVEVDESCFGGARILRQVLRSKRGRGAAGKVPVFGLLKRGGRVHAMMIPDVKSRTLMGIIRERIRPDARAALAAGGLVYSDGFSSYDVLDVSEFHHHRIDHSERFAGQRNHINGIPKDHFHLFLKECEWRFNHRPASNLLRTLRAWAKV